MNNNFFCKKWFFIYSTAFWHKQNTSPVCFGAKNNQFGSFTAKTGSKRLAAVKLVHLYGYVTCNTRKVSYWSYWGCGSNALVRESVNVVITTSTDQIILPPSQLIVRDNAKWSKIPTYNSLSPELILSSLNPTPVALNQQLRLWYGEDLMNSTEGDNDGTVCVEVYALFVWALAEMKSIIATLFISFWLRD